MIAGTQGENFICQGAPRRKMVSWRVLISIQLRYSSEVMEYGRVRKAAYPTNGRDACRQGGRDDTVCRWQRQITIGSG